jgi:hypothetical protein
VQTVPRPPPSVPLGGSLRASRAAQLALPDGPLAAVDLADGRALVAALRDGVWVELSADEATLVLPEPPPAPELRVAAASRRPRRRTWALVALAGAFAGAFLAYADGFSGTPAPAAAGPVAGLRAPVEVSRPRRPLHARGGRAVPRPVRTIAPAVPPPAIPAPIAVKPAGARPPAPASKPPARRLPPPLPVLPAAPAL